MLTFVAFSAKIQGTNISLDTEEDIAKWIEERKRKWPGQKNKELKLQQELKRKAYMDASPALQNRESGQQRAAKRSKFSKTNGPAQHPEGYQRAPRIWGQTVSNTQNSAASPANPSSDDEGDAADVAASLTKAAVVTLPTSNDPIQDKIDDSNARAEDIVDVDGNPIPDSVTEPKHLADDVAVREEEEHSDSDSAPEEVHTVKVKTIAELDEAPEQEEYQSTRPAAKDYVRRDCTTWMITGTCKFGKQCRFLHDPLKKGKQRREPPAPPKNPFERGDIIGKLVHNEIRHEISDLTQVIDFLARNDWLKNVELYPGHKREVEGRIEEVS